jgi:hypothetical protein
MCRHRQRSCFHLLEDVLLQPVAATRLSASCATLAGRSGQKCKPCAVRKRTAFLRWSPDGVWDSQATGRQIVLILRICLFAGSFSPLNTCLLSPGVSVKFIEEDVSDS